MGIKVNERSDYGFLFDSLNNNSKNSSNNIFNSINLSEYHSIKSGAYGKALKVYYAKEAEETDSTAKTEKEDKDKKPVVDNTAVNKLTEVTGNISSFKESAQKLIAQGENSVFDKKTSTVKSEDGTESVVEEYDVDAIYKAVSDFANKYNSVLTSMKDSTNVKITGEVSGLTALMDRYESSLNSVGITIGEDNKLTVSEETFKASDMDEVKKLFNGNTSFAYVASTKVSVIGTTANREANVMKNYTSAGNYENDVASTGNLLDDII